MNHWLETKNELTARKGPQGSRVNESQNTRRRHFSKNRYEGNLDFSVPEFTADIAFSMGLSQDRKNVSPETMMKVIAVMNSIHDFISGESFFCPMLHVDRKRYILLVKETLKFIHIPAFTSGGS